MLAKFLNLPTGEKDIDQISQRLQLVLDQIEAKEILDGQILSTVALVTGSVNNIPHKLGRELVGYIVILRSADCRIWDAQLTNTEKTKFLKLNTSANVTVSLWVF